LIFFQYLFKLDHEHPHEAEKCTQSIIIITNIFYPGTQIPGRLKIMNS